MKKMTAVIGKLVSKALFNQKAVIVLTILVIGLAGGVYYLWNQNQKSLKLLNNPSVASEEEIKALTEKVGKLMDLPKDEKPTIITVVDKEKLSGQKFFEKAENDDKVLVYTAAKQAIIYRTATNKIVTVGPVDLTPNQTFRVALYNGSATAATGQLADAAGEKLKSQVTNLEFLPTAEAKGKTYAKNQIIDLSGTHKTEAEQLAKIIEGEVTTLPSVEARPEADFMIIIAK